MRRSTVFYALSVSHPPPMRRQVNSWQQKGRTCPAASSSMCACLESVVSTSRKSFSGLGIHLPVILMTGHGDIPMSVRGMKAGAVDFLTKPFRDQDMLDAVATAIRRDRARRDAEAAIVGLREKFTTLSPREREVMRLVTAGKMNKQVAGDLGLSEITVKIHRGAAMRKMGAPTLADLVRMAEALQLGSARVNPV